MYFLDLTNFFLTLSCVLLMGHRKKVQSQKAPGVLGISGEWLFLFMELGSTGGSIGYYLRGSGEQAHSF